MSTSDFIEARWGDHITNYISPEERKRCDVRLMNLWRSMSRITQSQAKGPNTEEVHSPRSLPAILKMPNERPLLVWDAGLGTLFNHLTFPMPHSQPPAVIEAVLRRITGVRCVMTGLVEQAAAQVTQAQTLLKQTPIDRTYKVAVDVDDQFEVFLLTEMQERFALAHELGHYLKEVDSAAFDAFAAEAWESLRESQSANFPQSMLRGWTPDHARKTTATFYELELDPHAWYLHEREASATAARKWPSLAEEILVALHTFEGSPAFDREEIVCDLLAVLSVALAAHDRQAGWTAIMGAACSRLALSNLQAVLSIDEWVAGRIDRPWESHFMATFRQVCMNALLPIWLPKILDRHSRGSNLQIGDVHSVLHLVEDRFEQRIGAALSTLDWADPDDKSERLDKEQVLLLAGFFPLRDSSDHREVNRTAGQHKFELGNVIASPNIYALYVADKLFLEGITEALRRHQRGDWGEITREDREKNEMSLHEEFETPSSLRNLRRGALWSLYVVCKEKILVITSHDRTETNVLFLRDYG